MDVVHERSPSHGRTRTSKLGMNLLATPFAARWQRQSSRGDARHCEERHARAVPFAFLRCEKNEKPSFAAERRASLPRGPLGSQPLNRGGVERFAPGAGAICPRGVGRIAPPPFGSVLELRVQAGRGPAASEGVWAGFRSLGGRQPTSRSPRATPPARSGRRSRRCHRRGRRVRSLTAARIAAGR